MEKLTVVTTGPRDCQPSDTINALMSHLRLVLGPGLNVVQGGAHGSDGYVKAACAALRIPCITEPACWQAPCDFEAGWCSPGHRRRRGNGSDYCPAAGLRRNQLMLDRYHPLFVMAVLDRPLWSTRGTKDMVERSRRAGYLCVEVDVRLGLAPAVEAIEPALAGLRG